MQPLSKLLRNTVVGRMKPFKGGARGAASAGGKCTFDVGHQPNQESLRAFKPALERPLLLSFAGSFDVCCTGKFIRCRLAEVLVGTDGDPTVRLVPSRGARGSGRECTEKALRRVAAKRGITPDELNAEYQKLAGGATGNRYVEMARTMSQSRFCLAPAGDICTSSRFYSAIAAGCVPVVLCDNLKAAFMPYVNYDEFWVKYDTTFFMDDPLNLVRYLKRIAGNATEMRRRLDAVERARTQVLFQAEGDGTGVVANLLNAVYDCLHPRREGATGARFAEPRKAPKHSADEAEEDDEEDEAESGAAGSTKLSKLLRAVQSQQIQLLRGMADLAKRVARLEDARAARRGLADRGDRGVRGVDPRPGEAKRWRRAGRATTVRIDFKDG